MEDRAFKEETDKQRAERSRVAAKESEDNFREDGKHKINALLWDLLPPWTTLVDAEVIACQFHRVIHDMHSRGDPQQEVTKS